MSKKVFFFFFPKYEKVNSLVCSLEQKKRAEKPKEEHEYVEYGAVRREIENKIRKS